MSDIRNMQHSASRYIVYPAIIFHGILGLYGYFILTGSIVSPVILITPLSEILKLLM